MYHSSRKWWRRKGEGKPANRRILCCWSVFSSHPPSTRKCSSKLAERHGAVLNIKRRAMRVGFCLIFLRHSNTVVIYNLASQKLKNLQRPYRKSVLWNRNYFLQFQFRFRLLKSYGSGSDFWKSYSSGSGSYFWKVTVPVPVPTPYLFHKKQIFLKKFVSFLHSKLFYKEKDYKYQHIYCKMWFRFWLFNELRFRFNKAKSYCSYGSGSGSTTLQKIPLNLVIFHLVGHSL